MTEPSPSDPSAPSPARRRLALLAGGTALAALLAGCIVVPARGDGGGEYVDVAPPAPQAEVIGVAPVPGWIWIGGYWGWRGGRHTWIGGHWEAPRAGHYWVPHRWVPEGRRWRQYPGHWERR